MKANELKNNQKATVTAIHLKKEDARRLFYLGIYCGAEIQMIQKAPLQDPYLYYVQGSFLILRKKDAAEIEVIGS